jgi:predicted enzyme related to lactoylglutathione lyase
VKIRYAHTNIIAKDWKKLATFYQDVFACVPVPPERKLTGSWLEQGTGVKNASLEGVHLRLPGHGENGPTLELFQYSEMLDKSRPPQANREGYGHLAFQVDDVEQILSQVINRGGQVIGEIVKHEVTDVGLLTFVYVTDPEANIIELQNWS